MPKKAESKENQSPEQELPATEMAHYFWPSELDAPGAQQAMAEVNGLLSEYSEAGYKPVGMTPLGPTQLIRGGAIKGIGVLVLWSRG